MCIKMLSTLLNDKRAYSYETNIEMIGEAYSYEISIEMIYEAYP